MINFKSFSVLLIVIILVSNFVYLLRATKWWYSIRKVFPLKTEGPGHENIHLTYGKANLCGHYVRNKVFSGIIKDGVVIKKRFPISRLMPPIFIPWNEIERITIIYEIDGRPGTKVKTFFSSSEYAKIELKTHKIFLIIIPWQETYSGNLPKELTITS
ncbi:MAG: hypothetical protein KJ649_00320 [Proteobacteria bacterium]|nr:hypothetical protein [Pseudomonadota bacterium]